MVDTTKKFVGQITLKDMAIESGRELSTRKRVYPNWIRDRKIEQATADYRCLVMEALLRKLYEEARKDEAQGDLFQ